MLYAANQKGPYKVAGYHDSDSKRLIGIIFRPSAWVANTVYRMADLDNYDVVMPTVDTGVYYKVKSPGKSGATDPFSGEAPGDTVTDGSVIWEAVAFNLMPPSESLSTVTYAATNSVTISSSSNNANSCQFMIDELPAAAIAAGSFDVTVHFVKDNTEEGDVTLRFKVGTR